MPLGASSPMVALNLGSAYELYFLPVEYSLNDFPWSVVQVSEEVLVEDWAAAMPTPARNRDAAARMAEISS